MALRSGLEPLKKAAWTLRRKMAPNRDYFKIPSPPTSGIVEGLNRKVNLSIRKAYGFRCLETAKAYLMHQIGNLDPLPIPQILKKRPFRN